MYLIILTHITTTSLFQGSFYNVVVYLTIIEYWNTGFKCNLLFFHILVFIHLQQWNTTTRNYHFWITRTDTH